MQHYPSGGIGIGGAGGYRISGAFVTGNIFSLLADIATITNWNSVTEIAGQPLTNAFDYKHPLMLWNKGVATNTLITIGFNKAIDTIALINVNFASVFLNVIVSQEYATVRDYDTGLYNVFMRYSVPVTNVSIWIGAQTPNDGGSGFSIGAIIGGMRKDFSFHPMRPYRKRLIENISSMDFEAGNREEEVGAPSYHDLEYNFDLYLDSQFDEINEAVGLIGENGYCVVYEKNSDEENIYLAQLVGDYEYSRESYGRRQARLMFNECM